tara:strand:+ start:32812 stop:34008 length:1197 start_codon:yes stop_codon:yes gene_type:complete
MGINDYDISPDVNLTSPSEVDDFDAYVVDSITKKNTYRNFTTLTMKVVSTPVMINSSINPMDPIAGSSNSIVGSSAIGFQFGQQLMFRGRIIGNKFLSPHQLLEDPCNVTRFTGDDEGLLNVINQHTLCISKYDYSGAPLKIGDVVSVSYNPGDAGPIDLQHCYFDSIEQVVKPEAVAASKNNNGDCSKLSELFGSGITAYEFPQISWSTAQEEKSDEFFRKLKESSQFQGFSDNFLWGLTANAIAESGLVRNIGGDPESTIGKRDYAPIKNFCSFGYWQLQLCASGAEGTELLRTYSPAIYDLHVATADTSPRKPLDENMQTIILNLITAEHIQFTWVAQRMKELFPNDWNSAVISPAAAAAKICVDFERPIHKEKKGVERGKLATQISKDYESTQA